MFLRTSSAQRIRSECFHRNIEMSGVDDAVSLKLDPDAIHPCARKNEIELNLWPAIGKEWMCVHQVDQIVARGEHMAPGAEVLFKAFGGIQVELDIRGETGDRFGGNCGELDFQVFGILG